MPRPRRRLTRAALVRALTRLGQLCAAQKSRIEIAIYGGTVMMLAYDCREATKDIDAIFHPPEVVAPLLAKVARELDLPEDWMNDGVRDFVATREEKIVFTELTIPGPVITRPSPKYLLAMNAWLAAFRLRFVQAMWRTSSSSCGGSACAPSRRSMRSSPTTTAPENLRAASVGWLKSCSAKPSMKKLSWRRPRTLYEVVDLARTEEEIGLKLAEFLDHVNLLAKKPTGRRAVHAGIRVEPPRTRDAVQDAYLAAVAAHLARKHRLPSPGRTEKKSRRLDRPWFALNDDWAKAGLLRDSPAAFRERNLFTSEDALNRA
ncbi:MAG: hypothetical protein HZA93_27190 [Verrucomicrobia bacterium]|nr:hypothetical protein [Verrucomicrobiota bacterium]